MRREVERTKKMPSFSITVGELEELWNRLTSLWESDLTYCSLDIELASEWLEFSSISELRDYANMPDRITKFSMSFSGDGNRISMRSGVLNDTNIIVRATSDSEAWCAGAIETIYSYLNTYKKWYSWFNVAPIGWFLFFFGNIPNIAWVILPKDALSTTAIVAWLAALITIGILYVFRGKLFPGSILQVRESEGFIRKNSAELSLAIALLSLIATILGWFVAN